MSEASNFKGKLVGKWRIDDPIGEGSFAWVFKAREELDPENIVALKVFEP